MWALGCILFQMLTGQPPFKACSEYWTFQRILRLDLLFPLDFPLAAKSLVTKLLEPQPSRRIGYKSMAELRRDAYFAGVDFAQLVHRTPPELHAPTQPDRFEGAASSRQRSWSASDLECTPNTETEFLCGGDIDVLYSGGDSLDKDEGRDTIPRDERSSDDLRPGEIVLKATDIGVRIKSRRSDTMPCTLVLTDQPRLFLREREASALAQLSEDLSLESLTVLDVREGARGSGTFLLKTAKHHFVCETDQKEAESWVSHIRHYFLSAGQTPYTRRRCGMHKLVDAMCSVQ